MHEAYAIIHVLPIFIATLAAIGLVCFAAGKVLAYIRWEYVNAQCDINDIMEHECGLKSKATNREKIRVYHGVMEEIFEEISPSLGSRFDFSDTDFVWRDRWAY